MYSSRENIIYLATLFPHDIPKMMDILADTYYSECPYNGRGNSYEAQDSLEFNLMNMAQKPEMFLSEWIYKGCLSIKRFRSFAHVSL